MKGVRIGIGALVCSAGAAVWAIETRPAFGPWLADTVREVIGPEWVARGEDAYYAAMDRAMSWRYAKAPPAQMWKPAAVPVALPAKPEVTTAVVPVMPVAPVVSVAPVMSVAPPVDAPSVAVPVTPAFRPSDFEPPVAAVAAPGDGHWEAWAAGPDAVAPLLYRAQVHPDPARPQAVVAVMAIDLKRLELKSQPGLREPASPVLPASERKGLVPVEDRPALVAAFNGGWQAIHGHLGMKNGGVELLPPVKRGCTIAAMEDGSIRIAPWTELEAQYDHLRWMRQTPPCLVENGREDPRLEKEHQHWGAALSGATVVRRSALGINTDGSVLYYAIGDSLTSAAITHALEAAGAVTAAMLDINYSFPRFVTFQTTASMQTWKEHLPEEPLPPADEYLVTPAIKDFFYVRLRETAL